ncbi:uncharacterized protein SAPINGB_P001084 [Magnusiomyces paraingens]|uniref:Major facilitator superfamily (MFS) profile domain-containing protein n=1 Tax=Magnusiomyces paraingens TaxID=2606893 RepID=A0A5E8B3Y3_9ASCO|nr:uncharacterized protein SAPINGB_P001084 [Saprochaete ingens]VVT46177.1 unnamed protein product [Saprochaete ingens]
MAEFTNIDLNNSETLVNTTSIHKVDSKETIAMPLRFKKTRNILISGTIAVGGIILGYDTGSISGMLNMPAYIRVLGDADRSVYPPTYFIPSWRSGLVVGAVSLGGLFGSFLFGKAADRFGRRLTLAGTTGLLCISTLSQGAGYMYWPVVFSARLCTGLAIGGISAVCPMYISETAASPSLQTLLISSFQLLLTIGILIGQGVAYGASNLPNWSIWQFMLPLLGVLLFAMPLCVVALLGIIPESTKYLVSNGKIAEAKKSIAQITGLSADDKYIAEQVDIAVNTHKATLGEGDASWKQIFDVSSKMRYRVILAIGVMMLQQLSGINYFFYYGTSLFKEICGGNASDGSAGLSPYATSMILGSVNIIGTICLLPLVCKFPRRIVLLTGTAVMLVAFIAFSTLGQFFLRNSTTLVINPAVGYTMIGLVCIFIVGFAGTWAPCAFVVISEMFPLHHLRSMAISLAVASNWFINSCITFMSPIATRYLGYAFGYVFSGFLVLAMFVVYFFVYETKGLLPGQIEEMFTSNEVTPRNSETWRKRKVFANESMRTEEKV